MMTEIDFSTKVGALFMVVGGTYGLSLPLWGFLCDSKVPLKPSHSLIAIQYILLQLTKNSPKFVEVVGAILITTGFLILGEPTMVMMMMPAMVMMMMSVVSILPTVSTAPTMVMMMMPAVTEFLEIILF